MNHIFTTDLPHFCRKLEVSRGDSQLSCRCFAKLISRNYSLPNPRWATLHCKCTRAV